MAAQGHPSDGWFDTPVHPAIGFLLFVVGLVAFFVLTLYLVAEASGY